MSRKSKGANDFRQFASNWLPKTFTSIFHVITTKSFIIEKALCRRTFFVGHLQLWGDQNYSIVHYGIVYWVVHLGTAQFEKFILGQWDSWPWDSCSWDSWSCDSLSWDSWSWDNSYLDSSSRGQFNLRQFILGQFILGQFILGQFILWQYILGQYILGQFILGQFILDQVFPAQIILRLFLASKFWVNTNCHFLLSRQILSKGI